MTTTKASKGKAPEQPKQEIVPQPAATSLVTSGAEFEAFAGQGLENITSKDLLVSRLGILQSLSPQLKRTKQQYIPEAEEGQICDLAMGTLFPEGVWFLPVLFRKDYLEWHPRESGRGLAAVHGDDSILRLCRQDEKRRNVLPSGNYVVETAQFFGLNLHARGAWCFLPMTSTQLRKARQWNMLATSERLNRADGSEFQPPMWYRTYRLTTAHESNAEGDWHGWKIERDVALPQINREEHGFDWHSLKESAIRFQTALSTGDVKAAVVQEDDDSQDSSSAEGAM